MEANDGYMKELNEESFFFWGWAGKIKEETEI